jgi:S1-C subfamily serine protease
MAGVLENLSNDLAGVVETAGQSIVRVEARRRQSASGIIWSADGLIVTAHHVVERDDNIRIGLPDGSMAQGTLIGRDPTTDIAVLRVPKSGLIPATWAGESDLKVGHLVVAVGRPEAGVQATLGIISAIDGEWRTMAGGAVSIYIQTDVVMYPGFSGGPLVSAAGAFVGLNSSALLRGLSVTLPASTLRRVAEALTTHGRVKRGFLGVSAQPVRLPANIAGTLNQETGLLLISVEVDSPADKGGMMLGDTLVSLDGMQVRHMDDLMGVLAGDRVGKSVTAKVVRGGEPREMQVKIGERE